MPEYLHLRPHHLLCLLSFSGKGYSPEFIKRMTDIQQAYFNGKTRIEISWGVDDVCEFCPELFEDCCGRLVGVSDRELDRRANHILKIKSGSHLAEVLWRAIQHNYNEEVGYQICEGCSWLAEGGCPGKIIRRLQSLLDTKDDEVDGAEQ